MKERKTIKKEAAEKTQGTNKAFLLLSGGFDSPVAGKMMQEQGLELIALHFSQEPFTDNTAEQKSITLAKHLGIKTVITITIGEELAEITKKCNHRYYYPLQKRLMLKIAEQLAKEYNINYLVTGDNLGQVSSQTLTNLAAISQAVKIPILRPLLCFTKNEIIERAKQINTHDTSKGPEFCSVLGPKYPKTTSTAEQLEAEEKKVDMLEMIAKVIVRKKETKKVK